MNPSKACLAVLLMCVLIGCGGGDEAGDARPLPATAAPRPGGELKTFFIRPDGGDAAQCTGEADAPYPGQGMGQDCAWDHPFRALPPGGPPRLRGGDTLIIAAGSYPMGLGAPGAENPNVCDAEYPWDCVMPPVPSGPDSEHPTRILGAGWDAGCPNPPELWGTGRAWHVLDLSGARFVEAGCLEITDHAACAEGHGLPEFACERETPPYGEWAETGLYAEDARDIRLRDMHIHGMAVNGVWAGRLADWEVAGLTLSGNGWAGWDGDIPGEDSNSGKMHFSDWTVTWNGCVESYPPGEMQACWAQPAGGYGDGVGTGETGGHWRIADSRFLYNTSDGLDLLYGNEDIVIDIYRSWFEGNAGNQLKTDGPLTLENSVLIGNCAFFEGQPFTAVGDWDGDGTVESGVDHCRATGVTISLVLHDLQRAHLRHNTITGEGDCLVVPECHEDSTCSSYEWVILRNNLFQGQPDATQVGDRVCLFYQETFPKDPFDADYLAIAGVKGNACPGAHAVCVDDLGLTNPGMDSFDPRLMAGSPAVDAAWVDACPPVDYWGEARPQGAGCDIGAHEWLPRVFFQLFFLAMSQ